MFLQLYRAIHLDDGYVLFSESVTDMMFLLKTSTHFFCCRRFCLSKTRRLYFFDLQFVADVMMSALIDFQWRKFGHEMMFSLSVRSWEVCRWCYGRGSKKLIGKLPINRLPDELINWHCCLFAIIIAINRNYLVIKKMFQRQSKLFENYEITCKLIYNWNLKVVSHKLIYLSRFGNNLWHGFFVPETSRTIAFRDLLEVNFVDVPHKQSRHCWKIFPIGLKLTE